MLVRLVKYCHLRFDDLLTLHENMHADFVDLVRKLRPQLVHVLSVAAHIFQDLETLLNCREVSLGEVKPRQLTERGPLELGLEALVRLREVLRKVSEELLKSSVLLLLQVGGWLCCRAIGR